MEEGHSISNSVTHSLWIELGGKGEERGRGRRERRHKRQSKAEALDPEGGWAERGIRSAEAAIISCHHYLYGLKIYANAISGKKCWTKWVEGVKRKLCSCLATVQVWFFSALNMHVSVWFSICSFCNTDSFNLISTLTPSWLRHFWHTWYVKFLGKKVQGSGHISFTHVLKILWGSIPLDAVSYLNWLLTSILWLALHVSSQSKLQLASRQSRQRWKSDLAQPGDPFLFPCRAESAGGCLGKLYGGPQLLWAGQCQIRDVDPIQLHGSLLEFRNAGLRTLQHGSHIQQCHSIMMVAWQQLHAAGGRLTFS